MANSDDSVMIDPAFNGKGFNMAVANVPERKQEYAQGRYRFDVPNDETTVAVTVTDMLGDEVLGTAPCETRIAHIFGGYRACRPSIDATVVASADGQGRWSRLTFLFVPRQRRKFVETFNEALEVERLLLFEHVEDFR
jgi:hypothetical protein